MHTKSISNFLSKIFLVFTFLLSYSNSNAQESTLIAMAKTDKGWVYISETGKIIINDAEGSFKEDLSRMKQKGLVGFVDCNGKWVISPKFENARDFSEGLAGAETENGWGFIDKTGALVIKDKFDNVTDFSNGMAGVLVKGKWGFVDKEGVIVITPEFEKITDFNNGYACVRTKTNWVVIDKNGRSTYELDKKFIHVGSFSSDRIRVRVGDYNSGIDWGYIDTVGKNGSRRFDGAEDFSNGVARVRIKDKWGFIGLDYNYAINPQFDDCEDFTEDYTVARFKDNWGIINKNGEWVVQPRFEFLGKFANGLAPAKLKDRWGYINLKGEWVIKPIFLGAKSFAKVNCEIKM
jgi:hypothetical protein